MARCSGISSPPVPAGDHGEQHLRAMLEEVDGRKERRWTVDGQGAHRRRREERGVWGEWIR